MAIWSGLNMTVVSRLKKTMAALSSKASNGWEDLEEKLSYSNNYKTYREWERTTEPPLIPFFGKIKAI